MSQLEAGAKLCWWQLPHRHPHPRHHHHLRPVRGQTSPHTPLGSHSQLIFKTSKKAKCAVVCGFYFLSFFFFIRYKGENATSVVTSGHFPFGISILYQHFPFFHFNELSIWNCADEIASAHVALWLPGWKMILLFHAAGAFSTEIGLLPQCRYVQE